MSSIKTLKRLAQKFSLLYVEDDASLREKTSVIFHQLFKHVAVAEDGEKGLALYKEHFCLTDAYFDIVISDIQMPNLDGIAMSKAVFEINPHQKIIIVSAYNDTEYLVELINIGVAGFMQKPLSSEQIFDILFEVCSELEEKKQTFRYIELPDDFKWDKELKSLFQKDVRINLSDNETNLMDLFINNSNQKFTGLDIFNHLYFDMPEKDFSSDSVKSLIKRLRKKIPENLITNNPQSGYSLNLST